ncbi:MAG: tetratricopeptide repeat protein [Dehalococcoidia bacterium]
MNPAQTTTISAYWHQAAALWINRCLEALWLLAVVLVPLVYFNDAVSSLPDVAFWSVAKVTVLRGLVGLMVILWLAEWGLQGRFPFRPAPTNERNPWYAPSRWLGALSASLRAQPARWLILAASLYLGSVLLSTLLSASFLVSLWGEVPGLDNYSAYSILAYLALFGVLVTHLKTPAQLHRLLAAIIAVGVLVGGYAVLQHYGADFLGLENPFPARAGSTLGNPIFLGSLLVMTIALTLAVATTTLQGSPRTSGFWWRVELWILLLVLQMLGLLFAASRGPIGGTVVAVAGFVVLTGLFAGGRNLVRAGLVLGVAAALAGAIVLASPSLEEMRASRAPVSAETGEVSFLDRTTSAQGLSERIDIWKGSGRLMLRHPWFGFDDLSLPWLRPLIGYGPDLFRSTYLLEALPTGDDLKVGSNHGHNFFVHQGVEIGILGLLASLGIFAAAFGIGLYQLLREGRAYSSFQKLLLAGLLAALTGRFFEQLVGVYRTADLALFWILLAMLVVLPRVMGSAREAPEPGSASPSPGSSSRDRRRTRVAASRTVDSWALGRWALAAGLAVILGLVIWTKDVNYLRAAATVSEVNTVFAEYDLPTSLEGLDRAIDLAPDVSTYYNYRAAIYTNYRTDSQAPLDPECQRRQTNRLYEICLAEKAYQDNQRAVELRPLHIPSRFDLTRSAGALGVLTQDPNLIAEATRTQQELEELAPHSWRIKIGLAQYYLTIGRPEEALPFLETALAVTGDTHNSAMPLFLRGVVAENSGNTEAALADYAKAIERFQASDPGAEQPRIQRGDLYASLGQYDQAIEDYDQAISLIPEPEGELYRDRGDSYAAQGKSEQAIEDYAQAILLNPRDAQALNNRGIAYAELGEYEEAINDYDEALRLNPGTPLVYNNRGIAHAGAGRLQQAIEDYSEALRLSPAYAPAYNNRGTARRELGQLQEAIEDYSQAINLDPQYAQAYQNRGEIYQRQDRVAEAEADFARVAALDGAAAN